MDAIVKPSRRAGRRLCAARVVAQLYHSEEGWSGGRTPGKGARRECEDSGRLAPMSPGGWMAVRVLECGLVGTVTDDRHVFSPRTARVQSKQAEGRSSDASPIGSAARLAL